MNRKHVIVLGVAVFLAWLAGPGGRAALEPLGFGPPP